MKKGILVGFTTFLILLGILFAGMFIGRDFAFFDDGEKKIEVEEEVEDYEPVLEHEKAVIGVVEENLPAVVSIVASRNVQYMTLPRGDFFRLFEEPETRERIEREQGTGFIISKDGFIVTNRHVVEGEEADYTVFLSTGEKFEAKILAKDPLHDLAVLKIEGENLPVVEIGDSGTVRPGQTAVAIGNALGELENTVSVGVISGIGRRVVARGRTTIEVLDNVIQTDAAINLGNSGGPLLNLKGEVIGVNTATAMYAEGIGFAIPINRAQRVIEGAVTGEEIVYPFLGVRYLIIDEELKENENLSVGYGALVVSGGGDPAITPGSAAEEAGIKEEDIILELNGEKITANNSLARIIIRYNPGDKVKLKILRDGTEKEMEVVLGEMPN